MPGNPMKFARPAAEESEPPAVPPVNEAVANDEAAPVTSP